MKLENHIKLKNPLSILRVSSFAPGKVQEYLKEAIKYLNQEGIKFAYAIENGAIAEMAVDGLANYNKAKKVLQTNGIPEITLPRKPTLI